MASKRRLRRKQCEGKRRFKNYGHALRVQSRMQRNRKQDSKMTPYSCRFCGHYHFGHTPGQKRLPLAV